MSCWAWYLREAEHRTLPARLGSGSVSRGESSVMHSHHLHFPCGLDRRAGPRSWHLCVSVPQRTTAVAEALGFRWKRSVWGSLPCRGKARAR